MAVYSYVAMDSRGREVKGTLEAETQSMAVANVRELGYYPTRVTAQKAGAARRKAASTQISIPFLERVTPKQLTLFTRQLSTLIDAGLPIVRSLHVLKDQEKPGKLRNTIESVVASVEGGASFSEALAKFPRVFNKLYVSMVRAGEAGGVLETVLRRLAEFAEKQMALQKKIKSAMIYPIFVLVAMGGIVTFLVVFILPTFGEMFDEFDAALPGLTVALMNLSEFMIQRWYVIVGVIVWLVMLYKFLCGNSKTRYYMDRMKLKLPIFGSLITRIVVARFSRTLGTLVASGVPILQSLTITRDTVGNDVFSRAVMRVHDNIREGENIAPSLESSRVFPGMVIGMIDVGEETGSLDTMLNKIADSYDEEVDAAVAGMVSVLEPVMIIIMGAAVGTIVIAIFLPLIELGLIAGA